MRTVTVFLENGENFTTQINGSEAEIHKYYDNSTLNMGTGHDDLQKVIKIVIQPPRYITSFDGYIGVFQYMDFGEFPVYRFPGGARVADGWELEHGSDRREDVILFNRRRDK